jgi:hypothetical protein
MTIATPYHIYSHINRGKRNKRRHSKTMKRRASQRGAADPVIEPPAIEPYAIEPLDVTKRAQTHNLRRLLKRNVTRKFADNMKAKFLNTICTDAGVCIAFGTAEAQIKKFFNGFVDNTYTVGVPKRIGDASANGMIREITYEREGYKAYAVAKTAIKQTADNIQYEWRVGQYINTKLKQFPCFLETYGLIDSQDGPVQLDWKRCKTYDMTILIQHMKGIIGMKQFSKLPTDQHHVDMFCILTQVYMPLATMSNEFTHYDLHENNVQLYVPIPGKYIQYHYHLETGQVISFKSKYLVKILDYGRSYFKDTKNNIDSHDIYNDICAEKECDPDCGDTYGLSWLKPIASPANYFISSSLNNVSHDLRLISWISENVLDFRLPINYDSTYGTPEVKRTVDNTWNPNDLTVNNVNDMIDLIAFIFNKNPVVVAENEAYYNNPADLLGTMNVYHNADLTYVSADDRINRFSRS